jgi:hypothetical protein
MGTSDYRISCGFEPLTLNKAADFTGEWRLSDCENNMSQAMGAENTPFKLIIVQKDNLITMKSVSHSEWSDDEILEQSLTLDGKDIQSVAFMNAPRVQNAVWSAGKDTLTISSKIVFRIEDKPTEFKSREVWTLQKRGKKLVIIKTADGFMGRGPTTTKLVYNKY